MITLTQEEYKKLLDGQVKEEKQIKSVKKKTKTKLDTKQIHLNTPLIDGDISGKIIDEIGGKEIISPVAWYKQPFKKPIQIWLDSESKHSTRCSCRNGGLIDCKHQKTLRLLISPKKTMRKIKWKK